jgi:hypothetical protein
MLYDMREDYRRYERFSKPLTSISDLAVAMLLAATLAIVLTAVLLASIKVGATVPAEALGCCY